MYRGKKKGGESGGGVGTHHLMNHLMFCSGKRENLLILEHKYKYQKIQAHQHKCVEPKRIERLGFCVEDDLMYENGAGVYNCDGREAYGAQRELLINGILPLQLLQYQRSGTVDCRRFEQEDGD